ncbi:HNH endonuclease [Lelliottia amnigena]|uniref:HNH endonuclease n=1 Tax=Lelliottia amnigena TaxID=61646 RepID=UPI004055D31A
MGDDSLTTLTLADNVVLNSEPKYIDNGADNIFIINNKDLSMNYFYAYHGPANRHDFEFEKGYGVGRESTWNRVKKGDCVFVIQHPEGQEDYKLCGLYEIVGHYKEPASIYPLRFELNNITPGDGFIRLDETILNAQLPDMYGDKRLSIFKQHFCRQGATFQAPLESPVVAILSELLDVTEQYAEPATFREDGMQMVKVRRGQEVFRKKILLNWENKCAITGCTLALEACHIISHATKVCYAIENGIVLTADLHKLFDYGHLSIENNTVILSPAAQQEPRYARLHNQPLRKPLQPVHLISGVV